jgi:hypothetical protein
MKGEVCCRVDTILSRLRRWWRGPTRRVPGARCRPRVEELEPRTLPAGATLSGLVFQAVDTVDPTNLTPGPGIPGVQINAVGKLPGDSFSTTTSNMAGSIGTYTFMNLPADKYQVSTVLPTNPVAYWGFTAGSDSATVTLSATTTFTDLNFALTPENNALVQNLYQRVLFRPADAAGLNSWATALTSGGFSIGQVFNGFVTASEFKNNEVPMTNLLLAFSSPNQPPDPNLLRHNMELIGQGISFDAATLDILYSQQFITQHIDTSKLDDTAFVTYLYNTVLHRAPDPLGLSGWVGALQNGFNRGQVTFDFANSTEYTTLTNPNAFDEAVVSAAYQGILGRPVDVPSFQGWVNFLAAGNSITALGNAIAASSEFQALRGFTDPFLSDVQAQPITPPVDVLSRLQEYDTTKGNFDLPVAAGSIGSSASKPVNLYVIAHGWAPGYLEDVLLHSTPGNPLKVWDTVQFPGGLGTPEPESPWLFGGVDQVSVSGLAKSITQADPKAVVLAYSWIDQSGTSGSGNIGLNNLTPLLGGAQSEAYTQLNGLRMAEAIQMALNPNFFQQQGLLHILGHSHGSKVATVGALALQVAGVSVAQLTTFESPEDGPSPTLLVPLKPQHLAGLIDAQNFLWYYMQQMNVNANNNVVTGTGGRTPVAPGTGQIPGQFPTYIDNYFSQDGFGSALGAFAPGTGTPLSNPQSLSNIADVNLHPEIIYPLPTSFADKQAALKQAIQTLFGSHDYPPPWYAQASLMNSPQANGTAWSPLLNPSPTGGAAGQYKQDWTSYNFQQQYHLTAPTTPSAVTPEFSPFQYARQYGVGAVQDNGTGTITLGATGNAPLSFESLTFLPLANTANPGPTGTGLSFQFQFQGTAQPGDQLVIWARGLFNLKTASVAGTSVNTGTLGYQTVPLFVMSATDAGTAKQLATLSLDGFGNTTGGLFTGNLATGVLGATQQPQIGISLVRASGSTSTVSITNMQQFADGST